MLYQNLRFNKFQNEHELVEYSGIMENYLLENLRGKETMKQISVLLICLLYTSDSK